MKKKFFVINEMIKRLNKIIIDVKEYVSIITILCNADSWATAVQSMVLVGLTRSEGIKAWEMWKRERDRVRQNDRKGERRESQCETCEPRALANT